MTKIHSQRCERANFYVDFKLWDIDLRMEKDRDIKLVYYSHISKVVNTSLVLTVSVTIGWLAFLYVCLQNVALKTSLIGLVVGFILNLLFLTMFLALYVYNFLLFLIEVDLGIRNYLHNLAFPTWAGWLNKRRKKLLYLSITDVAVLSILIGFYLTSSLLVFGLTLFIPLLILIAVILIGSIVNLKKGIREKAKIFSKFEKVANP